jgi:carbonic anhydrase
VLLDRILTDNERYVLERRLPGMDPSPSERLAVLTCMDVRINVYEAFGLHLGEAHVLRNAGGRVTEDALRSLAISCHLLGVREVGIIHHTQCGLLTREDDLRARLEEASGQVIEFELKAIHDPADCLRADVTRLLECPYLPDDLTVWGARFDVETGHLEVAAQPIAR